MTAPSSRRDPLFEVDQLSLVYAGFQGQPPASILKKVSVIVDRGGALVLLGPSGSGKSTLLRCLNRLAEPTGRSVRFDGRDIRSLDPRDLRRRVALVMQTPVLFEGTVRDNLRVRPAGTPGDFSDASLTSAVVEVGLDETLLDRDAATLSGGEKQRVTIARALLRDPQALLLDEPTSALDPPNAALVVETVSRLRELRRLTIVAVTHQTELVRRLGGYLLYLVRGEVLAYEDADGGVTDARLQAFLAGQHASPPQAVHERGGLRPRPVARAARAGAAAGGRRYRDLGPSGPRHRPRPRGGLVPRRRPALPGGAHPRRRLPGRAVVLGPADPCRDDGRRGAGRHLSAREALAPRPGDRGARAHGLDGRHAGLRHRRHRARAAVVRAPVHHSHRWDDPGQCHDRRGPGRRPSPGRPRRARRRGGGAAGPRLLRARGGTAHGAYGPSRSDDSDGERHDDDRDRAAPGHDDGADPGRLLAAPSHQVPAGRGLHAGGAATALASLLFVRLAVGRYLTPAHQLRRYLL